MTAIESESMPFADGFKRALRPKVIILLLPIAFALSTTLAMSLSPVFYSFMEEDGPPFSDVSVAVYLQDSDPPIADAGINRTVYTGEIVVLNGSASSDDVGVLDYTWTLFDNGTEQTLVGEMVDYVFWTPGTFNVTLNVTDADGHWDTDTIVLVVEEDTTPPVIVYGNTTIFVGTIAQLNASLSTDNARIVNYTWTFEYDDEIVNLYGVVAEYRFDITGTYEVQLVVTDASGLSTNATVIVTVVGRPAQSLGNWYGLVFTALIVLAVVALVLRKLRKDKALLTSSDMEKIHLRIGSIKKTWKQYRTRLGGMFGLYLLIFFLVVAVFAPWISTKDDPNSIASARDNPTYASPSLDYPFGTDVFGRDVYSLTMYGSRASLMVGILASLISIIMGTAMGLAAGYFGKASDEILMRITDFFLVLPWFPLMIVIASLMGRSFMNIIIVIGITSWPSTARIVRAQVLSVKEMGFVERARAIGSRDGHIINKHILPNVFPLIFANTILLIANSIFSEAFLDFFGLGDPNIISWGVMLEEAYKFGAFSTGAWWWIAAPGTCIVLLIMSFYLIGDSLDEIFNPRLRKR